MAASGDPWRILFIDLAPAVGGSVISLYHLVKGLNPNYYEPHVILCASNGYASRFRDLGVKVRLLGESIASPSGGSEGRWSGLRQSRLSRWVKRSRFGEQLVHLAGFYLRTYPGLRAEARALREIMVAVRPDLVHLNDVICVSRAGIMAARQANIPAICHVRALTTRNHFDRRLSRALRGYICISHAVERHVAGLGGRIGPCWIVYNGIDLDEFADHASRASVRTEFGLEPQDVLVGCVGRLVAWKGQRVFLQALARLAPSYPHLRGLIVGAAEANSQGYAQELASLVQTSALEKVVTFTGFCQDVSRLLTGMDIMVHASTAPEPFGRVIIEGMAAGVPVIGTNAGAVPEIIQDGINGLLVAPDDIDAMAEGIAYALDHPEERDAWRREARYTVEQKFTAARYVRGVEQVYEEILT